MSAIQILLRRVRADGGRYLLSVGLTHEEFDAQPAPTYGGKGRVRWLTDDEYAQVCELSERLDAQGLANHVNQQSTRKPDAAQKAGIIP